MPHLCLVQHQKLHICQLLCCASGWCYAPRSKIPHIRVYMGVCVRVLTGVSLIVFSDLLCYIIVGECADISLFFLIHQKKKKKAQWINSSVLSPPLE